MNGFDPTPERHSLMALQMRQNMSGGLLFQCCSTPLFQFTPLEEPYPPEDPQPAGWHVLT